MPDLLNTETGKREAVSEADLDAALRAGKHVIDPGATYRVLSPEGDLTELSGEDALFAISKMGYGFAPADANFAANVEATREEVYGGTRGAVRAAAQGFLSGATVGVSDMLLSDMESPETVRGFEDVNPGAHMAGEIVGAVGTALAVPGGAGARAGGSGGQGLARAILSNSPAGLATRAGESLAARGAGRGALAEIGSAGVGYGVEGAIYGSGQYLSDVVLERKDLSAEAFVGAMSEGAMWGGGTGAAFTGLARGAGSLRNVMQRRAAGEAIPTTTLDKITPKRELAKDAVKRDTLRNTVPEGKLAGAKEAPIARDTARDLIPEGKLAPKPRKERVREGTHQAMDAEMDRQLAFASELERKAEQTMMGKRAAAMRDDADTMIDRAIGGGRNVTDAAFDVETAEIADRLAKLKASREKAMQWVKGIKEKNPQIPGEVLGKADEAGMRVGDAWSDGRIRRSDQAREHARYGFGRGLEDLRGDTLMKQKLGRDTIFDDGPMPAPLSDEFRTLRDANPTIVDEVPLPGLPPPMTMRGTPPTPVPGMARGTPPLGLEAQFPSTAAALRSEQPSLARQILGEPDPLDALSAKPGIPRDIAEVAEFEKAQHDLMVTMKGRLSPEDAARLGRESEKYASRAQRATEAAESPLGRMADMAAGMEVLQSLGVAGLPDVDNIPVIGPLLGWYLKARAARRGLEKVGILKGPVAEVARKGKGTRDRASDAIVKFLSGAEKVGRKAPKVAAFGSAAVLSSPLWDAEGTKRKADKNAHEAMRDRLAELDEARRLPDLVMQRLAQQFPLGDAALQAEIAKVVNRKLDFLASKAPVDTREPNPMGLDDGPQQFSQVEVEEFARYVRAADDPASVLEDLAEGQLTYEAAETLREVYPALYAEVQEEMLDQIHALRAALPYERRVSLSIAFGIPVEPAMSPLFMKTMQMAQESVGATTPQETGQMPPSSINPSVPSNLGELVMTGLDRRSGR